MTVPNEGVGLRPVEAEILHKVKCFAQLMQAKLQINNSKGGWTEESWGYLFSRLEEEVEELDKELTGFIWEGITPEGVTEQKLWELIMECVDVANFAMFLADKTGLLGEAHEI